MVKSGQYYKRKADVKTAAHVKLVWEADQGQRTI
jgi:hypothetical protein